MILKKNIKNMKNEWNKKKDSPLIDKGLMQRLQDHFCVANGMYLSCIGRREGVLTDSFGSSEELRYIHKLVDINLYLSLLLKVENLETGNFAEESVGVDYIKICASRIKVEEETEIVWIIIAFVQDKITEDIILPDNIITTNEVRFYKSVEFLNMLTKQLLAARFSENLAQEAMLRSEESKNLIEQQLIRSESMTEIVKYLESENSFSKIVDDTLEGTCQTLGITGGCLLRENMDKKTVDMICEYVPEGEYKYLKEFQDVPKGEVPFFTGNPYIISSDSMMSESFLRFFEKYKITAMICQPIEVNDRALMYLCFFDMNKDRIWNVADIKYLNDVKRIIQGILVKRIAKNSLASSYASLEAILENVGCGIYVIDPMLKKVLYTNQKLTEIYSNISENGNLEEVMFENCAKVKNHCFEEVYVTSEDKWLDIHKTLIDWVDGRRVVLCTIYDITDKKVYQKKIETQANNDFLTGLYNRMKCEQDLDRDIRKAELNSTEGALLYIDLDDFKHINDGLGHQCGDVLLKAISESLLKIEGIEERCYRMGGDEFIIIITDVNNREKLSLICDKIKSIFNSPWILKGENYFCSGSIGIATFPSDGSTVEDVIRKADMALFAAKRKGKNCIEFYKQADDILSVRRLDLEKNMRIATMNSCSEFEVYYQPIIDLKKSGNRCCGAEALVRWNSSSLGFIEPGDFIPLAEYLGLITPIGDYVIMEAAQKCKKWNEMGHPEYKVNVNISVIQLLQNDFLDKIKKVLEVSGVNPRNLCLEVTESLAINDINRMKKILSEVKSTGVGVALDDFGTGYSSLNRIRELPIDVIKIDKCFVENLGEDDFSDAFVKMVSELAQTIDVTVCVEGVETKQQLSIIRDMDIRLIQGFYFGKPMGINQFEDKYVLKNNFQD